MGAYASGQAEPTAWESGFAVDVATVLASFWLMIGLHLDGWAHAHKPGLESFFTPWHGALYSGFFALAGVVLWSALARRRTGDALAELRVSLAGVAVFLVGGAGDLAWHTLFGIEANIEALLSPTHLMLATGMLLMVSGPLRRAWTVCAGHRPGLPALASAAFVLAALTFFTQFLQPGGRPWALAANRPTFATFTVEQVTPDLPVFPGGVPAVEVGIMLGVAGMVVATAFAVVMSSILARHFELRFGHLALVLLVPALFLGMMRDTWWLAPAWLAAGIAADAALRLAWRPRVVMAAALPLALWASYFAILAMRGGVWWSVHAWAGAIALCTAVGLLLGIAFEASAGSRSAS